MRNNGGLVNNAVVVDSEECSSEVDAIEGSQPTTSVSLTMD